MIHAQFARTEPVGGVAEVLSSPLAGSRPWTSTFLSWEERQALRNAISAPEWVEPHTDLMREGASTNDLFIVVEGRVFRYSTTNDGGRQLSALLLPGDMGNLDSLMFDRLEYGVRTLTGALIARLPRDAALALSAQHSGIARTFTWLALLENMILTKWTQSLGRRSAKSRLAHLLCETSMRLDGGHEGESRFWLPLTQEQMADVLGLTSVHVNRVLQQLKAEGLVATRHRTMILADVARLRRAAVSIRITFTSTHLMRT